MTMSSEYFRWVAHSSIHKLGVSMSFYLVSHERVGDDIRMDVRGCLVGVRAREDHAPYQRMFEFLVSRIAYRLCIGSVSPGTKLIQFDTI